MAQYTIAVIGLGFVGLEIALALSEYYPLYGYDNNQQRIDDLMDSADINLQSSKNELKQHSIIFTSNIENIKHANVYIITVPTPVLFYEFPDLEILKAVSQKIGGILKKNDIVIYESSVYPGTTQEICIPLLEASSNLKENIDFFVAYSPERICPSDTNHNLKNMSKIISANHPETLKVIHSIYEKIALNVYPVSQIEHAEAAKMLENIQRDVNIALMNEFSKIMHAMNLNMHEILEAAATKFNFIPFKPGLVGGHCISVDPLYVAFQAKRHSVQPELILCARKINDSMTQFILQEMLKILVKHVENRGPFKVGIFGVTYKENIPDIRNSLIFKFLKECKDYPFEFEIHDPFLSKNIQKNNVTFPMKNFDDIQNLDLAIIFNNNLFYEEKGLETFIKKCKPPGLIMDIPNMFINDSQQKQLKQYWHL
ncbi:MAG TPA: nucleotide sugar dehydrogenase [Legionellales bacterium]|nr:nucleotide sugar dehydrogenase [Legionellales bacterium]